jgi:uncharacterized protein
LSRGARLFGELAEGLARNGVAVLRWDDRGTGSSAPRAEEFPPLQEVLEDVMALSTWVRKRPEINPRCIVLLGHSAGGLVALTATKHPTPFAGLVLMAAPGRPLYQMFLAQDEAAIEQTPEPARDSVRRDRHARRAERLREDAFVRGALALSPESLATAVRIPALVLQGDADRQVAPDNALLLAEALKRGGAPIKLRILPGLTHFFVPPSTEAKSARHRDGGLSQPGTPLAPLTEWISELSARAGCP